MNAVGYGVSLVVVLIGLLVMVVSCAVGSIAYATDSASALEASLYYLVSIMGGQVAVVGAVGATGCAICESLRK